MLAALLLSRDCQPIIAPLVLSVINDANTDGDTRRKLKTFHLHGFVFFERHR